MREYEQTRKYCSYIITLGDALCCALHKTHHLLKVFVEVFLETSLFTAEGLRGVSLPLCYHGAHSLSNQTQRSCLHMGVNSPMFKGI